MRIPGDSELDSFGADLIGQCLTTRKERVQVYSALKHYFLFGAQEGDRAPYNKIYPQMDLLTAFLYSQSTVEFDVAVENVPDPIVSQAELITKRLNINFHDCGVADMFKECLLWGLVFNTTFLKLNWARNKLRPYFVEPHNFGVINEAVPDLNRQEAFVHCYRIGDAELKRRVQVLPNAADIMRRVSSSPTDSVDAFPEPINRLIIAGTSAMTTGVTRGLVNMPDLINSMAYKPRPIEDTIEMYELWVWDDSKDDYRTITMADPGVVIYGRKEIGNLMGVKGEHPFVKVCPNQLYDYFYGWSELTNLVGLQDWVTVRLREIRRILSLQANPPKALSGWTGLQDEKIAGLSNEGSWISEQNPNAKVELLAPTAPDDLWQELHMIQGMFNDETALSDVLQGRGETGVRATSHASVLARLGSARIKQRALTVEKTLEEVGEKITKLMRSKDARRYTLPTGESFVAGQFTEDYGVHVDAHTASPVFVDDHTQLAFALNKAGSVGPDSLLDLTKPPRYEKLKHKLEKMMQQQAQKEQQMAAIGLKPDGTR